MTPKSALAIAAVILVACDAAVSMPEPPEGEVLFAENCTACHGTDARGGVPGDLAKTPPDLTRIAARRDGVFPVAEVLSEIDGYAKGAHPERIMPEFGDTLTGDTVPVDVDGTLTPTPRPLAALLVYLESIQRD
jgi:mono/diheme cytochrome c family protein